MGWGAVWTLPTGGRGKTCARRPSRVLLLGIVVTPKTQVRNNAFVLTGIQKEKSYVRHRSHSTVRVDRTEIVHGVHFLFFIIKFIDNAMLSNVNQKEKVEKHTISLTPGI